MNTKFCRKCSTERNVEEFPIRLGKVSTPCKYCNKLAYNKKRGDISIDIIDGEIWADAVECPDKYFITTKGRLTSKEITIDAVSRNGNPYKLFRPAKVMSQATEKGYKKVTITYGGKKYRRSIHQLMGQAFIPNPENKPTINHDNTIKDCNEIENLEWNTIAENTRHAWINGCCTPLRGEKNVRASITNFKASVIRRFFRIYPKANQRNVAKKLNITTSSVCNILKNKSYINDSYEVIDRGINSKTLTAETVLKIREIGKSQKYSVTAEEFNTTKHIVYQIVNNISWEDLK
jgi:hypothetical protein